MYHMFKVSFQVDGTMPDSKMKFYMGANGLDSEMVDVYVAQCSVSVGIVDLEVMAALNKRLEEESAEE